MSDRRSLDSKSLPDFLSGFEQQCSPELLLERSEQRAAYFISSAKRIHDFLQRNSCSGYGPLPELYTEGLVSGQVWEEIQLANKPFLEHCKRSVRSLSSWSGNVLTGADLEEEEEVEEEEGMGRRNHTDSSEVEDSSDLDDDDDDDDDDADDDNCNDDDDDDEDVDDGDDDEMEMGSGSHGDTVDSHHRGSKKKKDTASDARGGKLDDDFFKISEMNEFLDREDQLAMDEGGAQNDEDDGLDYFREIPTTSDSTEIRYKDFFDPPSGRRPGNAQGNDDDGDESEYDDDEDLPFPVPNWLQGGEMETGPDSPSDSEDSEKPPQKMTSEPSAHEKKMSKMESRVVALEKDNMADKPWQLIGEVGDRLRPENSLLEQHLQFDHVTRPAPVITEDTTQTIEDMLRQRIRDEAWDDVERKVKPKEVPYNYRVKQPLNQEKSQLSLAQVYEEEYIQQTATAGEREEFKEDQRHTEIRTLTKALFLQLDALTNFRYTPKPLKEDIKIVANVPALSLEEATPTSTSDSNALAPEEIEALDKRPYEIEETEMTSTDKKRKRRQWKNKAHFMSLKRTEREKFVEKLKPGLGNKSAKKDALKMLEKAGNTTLKDLAAKDDVRKVVRTSTQMFSELQDKMSSNKNPQKRRTGQETGKPSSTVLKL